MFSRLYNSRGHLLFILLFILAEVAELLLQVTLVRPPEMIPGLEGHICSSSEPESCSRSGGTSGGTSGGLPEEQERFGVPPMCLQLSFSILIQIQFSEVKSEETFVSSCFNLTFLLFSCFKSQILVDFLLDSGCCDTVQLCV